MFYNGVYLCLLSINSLNVIHALHSETIRTISALINNCTNFHIRTVYLDIIKVLFIHQLMH